MVAMSDRARSKWFNTIFLLALAGCGTTRMSDTVRTATEQILISNAVDQAVTAIDCSCLRDKTVFLDEKYLDGVVDKGYVISSIRQHLLAAGCLLQEDRTKAMYVVELRSGAIGTDRHSLLVGIPQMTVPTFLPGQPSQIPEVPIVKKNDEQGVAKIALFAYNRLTGERIWQSGTVEAVSTAKDSWVFGLGPFRGGTISPRTEFAGQEIPLPLRADKEDSDNKTAWYITPVTGPASWEERRLPQRIDWKALAQSLAKTTFGDKANLLTQAVKPEAKQPSESPPFKEPSAPNARDRKTVTAQASVNGGE